LQRRKEAREHCEESLPECYTVSYLAEDNDSSFIRFFSYDHTRIKLNVENGTNSDINDYINANLVEVMHDGVSYAEFENINKRYISTQGCLQNTVGEFWQMVSFTMRTN
jgi:protein tyrosine phosphatase